MPDLQYKPGDDVDLMIALNPAGGPETTSVVKVTVKDPDGTAVTGSPFTLAHEANGVHILRNAFSVSAQGIYQALYIMYDAGGVIESTIYSPSRRFEKIQVKSEPVFGQSLVDAALVNEDEVVEKIAKKVWGYSLAQVKSKGSAAVILKEKPDDIPAAVIQKVDLKPLGEIKSALKDLKNTDLKPVLSRFDDLEGSIDNAADSVKTSVREAIKEFFSGFSRDLKGVGGPILTGIAKNFEKSFSGLSKLVTALSGKTDKQHDAILQIPSNVQATMDVFTKTLSAHKEAILQENSKLAISVVNQLNAKFVSHFDSLKTQYEELSKLFSGESDKLQKLFASVITEQNDTVADMLNQLNGEEASRLAFLLQEFKKIIRRGATGQVNILTGLLPQIASIQKGLKKITVNQKNTKEEYEEGPIITTTRD